MFGHNDNNQKQNDPVGSAHDDIAAAAEAIANDNNAGGGGTLGSFMPGGPAPSVVTPTDNGAPAQDQPDPASPLPPAPADLPAPHDSPAPAAPAAPAPGAPAGDLLDIKHEALQALTPLVNQLDQTPEEQFRTTMMMIQASDNHALVKTAYEAAQRITDEKERAQALLDIVNEINYFTQQNQQ